MSGIRSSGDMRELVASHIFRRGHLRPFQASGDGFGFDARVGHRQWLRGTRIGMESGVPRRCATSVTVSSRRATQCDVFLCIKWLAKTSRHASPNPPSLRVALQPRSSWRQDAVGSFDELLTLRIAQ